MLGSNPNTPGNLLYTLYETSLLVGEYVVMRIGTPIDRFTRRYSMRDWFADVLCILFEEIAANPSLTAFLVSVVEPLRMLPTCLILAIGHCSIMHR